MISPGINPQYWKRAMRQAEKMQIVGEDIPPVESVFDLKSGARAKLVDRSGSMVIVEVEKYRPIGSNGARSKQGCAEVTRKVKSIVNIERVTSETVLLEELP